MTSFRDRPWETRLKGMGDIAEHAFEKNWQGTWARTGFNRPALDTTKVPAIIMFQPDYLAQDVHGETLWVEVQGCGADGIIKLKDRKLTKLQAWQSFTDTGVFFWFWNSSNNTYAIYSLNDIMGFKDELPRGKFPEGHVYYELPADGPGWKKGNPT